MLWLPPYLARPGEVAISTWSHQGLGFVLRVMNQSPASSNYVTANLVVYVPFWVPEPMTITKLWWGNGGAVAGNLDMGVYDTGSSLLVSTGSVAQAGTSNIQVTDVTDTTIARGYYYMGIVSDTSGATQKVQAAAPAAGIAQSLGLLQQAGVTLPLATNASPATFAKYASAFVPQIGLQGYRTFGP